MKERTQEILVLRQQGWTYRQIIEKVGCSQGTVSRICRLHVPDNDSFTSQHAAAAAKNLNSYRQGALKQARVNLAHRKEQAIKRWVRSLEEYSDRNFVHYIAGLYDGEGSHSGKEFRLSNSNPKIISAFLTFLREVCHAGVKATVLSLHLSHDREVCQRWWESFDVPISCIYQYDGRNQMRDYSTKENYGTVSVRVEKPLGLYEALGQFSYCRRSAD